MSLTIRTAIAACTTFALSGTTVRAEDAILTFDELVDNVDEMTVDVLELKDQIRLLWSYINDLEDSCCHVECPCGDTCTMADGTVGTCGTDDTTCAVWVVEPQCDTTTTTSTTTVKPPFAWADRQCDGTEYCTIETKEPCEKAAAELGNEDTKANALSKTQQVAGCSTGRTGALRFNEELASTAMHGTNGDKKVICQLCD